MKEGLTPAIGLNQKLQWLKCLPYLGPEIWNSLSSDSKCTNSINSFKDKIKDKFFQNIQRGKWYVRVPLKPTILSYIHDSAFLNYAFSKST